MRIGYLHDLDSGQPTSGGAIHVRNLVGKLVAQGHNVHTYDCETNRLCTVYRSDSQGMDALLANIDVLYVRIDGTFIHQEPLILSTMERRGPIPMVWEVNAPAEEELLRHQQEILRSGLRKNLTQRWRRQALNKRIALENDTRRRLASSVRAAICMSDASRDYAVEDLGVDRAIVIPNGGDPEMFSPERANHSFYSQFGNAFRVVYAGDSRWPWQPFDTISQVAELAHSVRADVQFIVLDNAPSVTPRMPKNVSVYARIPYEEASAYIAGADLALCLYRDVAKLKHGFHLSPLKLFDYMASGLPVVGSRLGQIAQIIEEGETGWLVDDEPLEIYHAISEAQKNPIRAASMGAAGRARVMAQHTWSHVAEKTAAVLARAVDENGT